MNIYITENRSRTIAKAPAVFTDRAFKDGLLELGYFPDLNIHTQSRWCFNPDPKGQCFKHCDVKNVVMRDSSEAATYRTVTGWVSRNGRFYGKDERLARYDGSTHEHCDCGLVKETNRMCDPCSSKRSTEKYLALEPVEYSEDLLPIATDDGGKYFFDEWSLKDYLAENMHELDCTANDLMLVDTDAGTLSEIELDHWCDDLAEDYDETSLPEAVRDAWLALNAAISNHNENGQPVAYYTGKRRIVFPDGFGAGND